jgi:hypothetical protein
MSVLDDKVMIYIGKYYMEMKIPRPEDTRKWTDDRFYKRNY